MYAVWKSNSRTGEPMELGGYKWHILSDYNGYITLLMDAGQIGNMAHCGSSNNSSNNCTYNGSYYVYSWDKSLINNYLKNTLYPELKNKITNEIVPVSVCIDPSRGDGKATYGGYLKTEIDKINGASCNNGYETDYVRLITNSEYFNLSPYYSGTNSNYPNVSGITRLSRDSDYANWLYCDSNKCGRSDGWWWTMASSFTSSYNYVSTSKPVLSSGVLSSSDAGMNPMDVRPVITIKK